MKKILFLLLTAFALTSCNDDCNHSIEEPPVSDFLVGSWYEETLNEEDTYSPSGTFYGRFCNTIVQGEGRGTYFISSELNTLTWDFEVNGSPQMTDWKLTNRSKRQFTMSSDVAKLTYGKIVESYTMEAGESKQISYNEEHVFGYESNNENIATVTSDGLITTTGEKGTAYIKIKLNNGNVWAKVVVGDDTPDLWIDYSYLLGRDYTTMKDTLGVQSKSLDFGDYTSYTFLTSMHNILNQINVYVDNTSHIITQMDMYIKAGVTQEEILAYMNSRYYKIEGNFANQYHYSTSSTLKKSRATYAYDTERKAIIIMSEEDYEENMKLAPWPNFRTVFALSKEKVKSEMDKRGYMFYQSMDNYSFNGSEAYLYSGWLGSWAVEFVYNPDNVVSEYWIYLTGQSDEDLNLAYDYLCAKYTEATDEEVPGYGNIFYNADRTNKIKLDVYNHAVVFYDMTLQPVDRVILGNYWQGLGKSEKELVEKFGAPYLKRNNAQGDLQYTYNVINDCLASATFNFNRMTNNVNLVNVFLRDDINASVVTSYLNRFYTFKEEEQSDNGPKLIWINAASEDEADMRISYYPDYNVVAYKLLIDEEPVPDPIFPDYSTLLKVAASQVIASMGKPDREFAGSYIYDLSGHEYVKRIMVRFSDNPIKESSLSSGVSVTLNENHNQEKVLEYLNSIYTADPAFSTSSAYGFKTKDGKIIIQYTPSTNTIVFV